MENDRALASFVDALLAMRASGDVQALFEQYGVSRWRPGFCGQLDSIHEAIAEHDPIAAGLLDLSRLAPH